MTDSTSSWREFYQYATAEPADKLDGYWLFATPLDGEIELFQVGTMVVGDQVRHTVAAVVTPDGVRYERRGSDTCVRDGDRFRIQVGPLLTVTSDDGRSFRIQTHDEQNGVAADLEVRPRTPHEWDMGGAFYGTALESDIEGTISIDDVAHRISTTGAFEHAASWRSTNDAGGGRPIPPFWQYEFIQWADDVGPAFATILWHSLDEDDNRVPCSELRATDGAGGTTKYDSFDIAYEDVRDQDGRALPGAWEVRATKGEETLSYRADVRRLLSTPADGTPGVSDFLIECEGVHRTAFGEKVLRGRGRTEYLVLSHNPNEVVAPKQ